MDQVIPRFDVYQLALKASHTYLNPFTDVMVTGFLRTPSGQRIEVPGFYDGDNTWRIRAIPHEVGRWSYAVASQPTDSDLQMEGTFECVPSNRAGFLRQNLDNPYGLSFDDGTPFFFMGDTCYNLVLLDRTRQRLPYLQQRRGQGFTVIRLSVTPHEFQNDRFWAWGGTVNRPDLDRLNLSYFQRLDEILEDMKSEQMMAEIILVNFYTGPQRDPVLWTGERQRLWLRYLIARYASYTNMALWTLANEFETHPDGVYRFDEPDDLIWVDETARFLKENDPYHHLITVHPCPKWGGSVGGPPGGPGYGFGTNPWIDVINNQTHGQETDVGRYRDGSGDGLEQKVLADRIYEKPVIIGEFGYEHDGYTVGSNISTDLLRRSAWRIALAGGYFSAGFRSTVFNFPWIIVFDVKGDLGGPQQLSYLYGLLSRTSFWRMHPHFELINTPNLCLADPGQEYVVYMPDGGMLYIDLSDCSRTLQANWLNPISGRYTSGVSVGGRQKASLIPPFDGEAVLHLS